MGDPEIISAHMVSLFCRYPLDRVIRSVTRLVEECKFIPRIAEIKKVLDEESADVLRQGEREARVMLPPPEIQPWKKTYAEHVADYHAKRVARWGESPGEKSKHWADAVAAKLWKEEAELMAAIPDSPLRDWKKMK